MSSSVARAVVNMLGGYQAKPEGMMPSQSEYTSVRDYLVTSLCINNSSRSGALANMTVGEFKKAQPLLDDSFVVMKVRKHKTFTTHGPANIVLSATLHNCRTIFLNKFRYPVANMTFNHAKPVFLSWSNRPMDASHMVARLTVHGGKCTAKIQLLIKEFT
jgi:hypothetical protein